MVAETARIKPVEHAAEQASCGGTETEKPASKGSECSLGELSRDQLEEAIQQWIIGRNGERDRRILRMYMFDGITFSETQRRLDNIGYPLSIDQIKKIVKKRKEELFRHI